MAKNTRQSNGTCNQLKTTINIGRVAKPKPILIRFLSNILPDSFTNLVIVNPKPHVYTKNNRIVNSDILVGGYRNIFK